MGEIIQLYNYDCIELMRDIPSSSIDCIICDPPYGKTCLKWDKIIDFSALWDEYKRIIKPNGALCKKKAKKDPPSSRFSLAKPIGLCYNWVNTRNI